MLPLCFSLLYARGGKGGSGLCVRIHDLLLFWLGDGFGFRVEREGKGRGLNVVFSVGLDGERRGDGRGFKWKIQTYKLKAFSNWKNVQLNRNHSYSRIFMLQKNPTKIFSNNIPQSQCVLPERGDTPTSTSFKDLKNIAADNLFQQHTLASASDSWNRASARSESSAPRETHQPALPFTISHAVVYRFALTPNRKKRSK